MVYALAVDASRAAARSEHSGPKVETLVKILGALPCDQAEGLLELFEPLRTFGRSFLLGGHRPSYARSQDTKRDILIPGITPRSSRSSFNLQLAVHMFVQRSSSQYSRAKRRGGGRTALFNLVGCQQPSFHCFSLLAFTLLSRLRMCTLHKKRAMLRIAYVDGHAHEDGAVDTRCGFIR